MRMFGLFLFTITLFLFSPILQTNLLAESQNRGIKAGVGAVVTVGALASWWYFGKELKKVEKLQEVFAKMNKADPTHMQRLKKFVKYKTAALVIALFSFGYTLRQIAGIFKDKWVQEALSSTDLDPIGPVECDEEVISYTQLKDGKTQESKHIVFYRISGSIITYGVNNDDGILFYDSHLQVNDDTLISSVKDVYNSSIREMRSNDIPKSMVGVWNKFQKIFEKKMFERVGMSPPREPNS